VVVAVLGTITANLVTLLASGATSIVVTPGYLATHVVVSVAGAIAGGYTTAMITSGRSFFTVFILALVLFMSGIAPVLRGASPLPGMPTWYPVAIALLVPLGALIGGCLERRPRLHAGPTP
jgi:hypothetical protein